MLIHDVDLCETKRRREDGANNHAITSLNEGINSTRQDDNCGVNLVPQPKRGRLQVKAVELVLSRPHCPVSCKFRFIRHPNKLGLIIDDDGYHRHVLDRCWIIHESLSKQSGFFSTIREKHIVVTRSPRH